MIGISFGEITVVFIVAAVFMKPQDIATCVTKCLNFIEKFKEGFTKHTVNLKNELDINEHKAFLDTYNFENNIIADINIRNPKKQNTMENKIEVENDYIDEDFIENIEHKVKNTKKSKTQNKALVKNTNNDINYNLFDELEKNVVAKNENKSTVKSSIKDNVNQNIRGEIEEKYLLLKNKINKYKA